MLYLKNYQC